MSTPADAVTVDPENPWLGLFSYSEETLAYFHGREEETAELARRVQRKLLTVLFGQSGLGKTSLLRAGIVPRLRTEGFCPIYVRIDYAPESPSPSEQIKQEIFKASAVAGDWTLPGSAVEGESLWEFLHHRSDLLRDGDGRALVPLLIFDQFEEIFTLGQADDAGRLRARQFLDDLADLVENRPPAALEARIENDDTAAESFDFARADYRILIALREDYLAHLESVKGIMPSITQNRMRLARMTGTQALSAVVKPGGRLVSQEVAESIVRFVAGGSELGNAEIEPSLLSLVCRELNTVRQLQGRSEISADLLAGSRDTILSEFYERTLADQPAGVRRVIEDDLLTDSGYRESLAEERVIKALVAAGAAPDALSTLVNRRLLRIEERLDMRRVELTHDVLCSVVLASRNLRQEREARDDAERRLAEQKAREATTHRALLRARMIATVCAVLMLLAGAGAIFGWVNMHRARSAELEAQTSRSNAEKLVSFLIEDFYSELEPTGRLDTLGKLAHMTVGYYDGLPPELVTPQTRIYRAMALVREGAALQSSGNIPAAYKNFGEAETIFERLRAAGDQGEPVTYGLALALTTQGYSTVGSSGGGRGTAAQLTQSADMLRPLVYGANPSRRVRSLYADTLNILSHSQTPDKGVASCAEARKVLVTLGALQLADLNATASYADTADSESRELLSLGRVGEARALEQQVYDLAEKVLAQRPGDLHALSDRSWAAELIGSIAGRQHDLATADDYSRRAAQAGEDEVRFNPSDMGAWQRWASGLQQVADLQFERGEVSRSIASLRSLMAMEQDPRRPSDLGPNMWFGWAQLGQLQAQAGDFDASTQSVKGFVHDTGVLIAPLPANDPRRQLLANPAQQMNARLELFAGQTQAAFNDANAIVSRLDLVKTAPGSSAELMQQNFLSGVLFTASHAALRLGRYPQAEALARRWLALPPNPKSEDDPRIKSSQAAAALGHALAAQARNDEAQATLQPALAFYSGEQHAGAAGTSFRQDFAYALYVSALTRDTDVDGHAKRAADLNAAVQLIDGSSTEAKQLASMRDLSGLITAARVK